jgi:hypothetical protein
MTASYKSVKVELVHVALEVSFEDELDGSDAVITFVGSFMQAVDSCVNEHYCVKEIHRTLKKSAKDVLTAGQTIAFLPTMASKWALKCWAGCRLTMEISLVPKWLAI